MSRNRRILTVILLTAAASFIYAINAGIRNNYGIMLRSITESSGMTLASVSFVLAVGQLFFGLVQPFFGALASKRGTVPVLIFGALLIMTGLLLVPGCTNLFSLLLCLGILLPAGTGVVSYGLLVSALTPKLPERTVSVVSGIINASSGIGNTLLSPVIQSLLSSGGLMYCMAVLAAVTACTIPASIFVGRGTGGAPQAARTAQERSVPTRELLRGALETRTYRFLMAGFFTCGFHMALITNHLPTQFLSYGFSEEVSVFAFSIYGITTLAGSTLSGICCCRWQMKNVLGCLYGSRPLMVLLFFLMPKTVPSIVFYAALLGLTGAATVPPVSGLIGKHYGATNVAMLYGLVFFVHQIGGFLGAWLGGICFDLTGSYTLIWTADIVLGSFAATVSFLIRQDDTNNR